ncbi:MAG: NUDIX hydrolase [Rickettsiales bacterium]|nr:NUDIX hydrolase [Rickettsiales bacterium]|tara:strand:- start:142 stop:522 length:381 start_codon:yes stop_codon:yes gene_type:complete
MKKSTHVVAAIIKKDAHFLIVQRNKNKHLGLKWEFPGGKVNANEEFEEALKREIKEELNISIKIYEKIAEEGYKDEKIDIILHYYLCSQKNGTIKLNEHENLAWVEKKDFKKYNFAEGDGNILSSL